MTIISLKSKASAPLKPIFQSIKRTIGIETDDIVSTTETERLIEHTLKRMSDHKLETSPSVSITFEEGTQQFVADIDPLTQQLPHVFDLMRGLKIEQVNRRHEDTTSSRTASSSSGSGTRFGSGSETKIKP